MLGRAAELGLWTEADMETLPLSTWYGLMERWYVEAHVSALSSAQVVLEWLTVKLPEEWERLYPDPDRHGMSERQQAAQRAAEAAYGAAG